MAVTDDDQRDDEDVDEFGVPRPRKVLDPETEAIAAEFSGEQTGLPVPANPDLSVDEVMARVNDPSNARLLSQPAAVNKTMPEPTPSGIPGATVRESLPEAPKPSTLPAAVPEPAPAPEKIPAGAGAKNYDVVEGADQLTWGDTSRLSGFNTNEWGEGGSAGYHDNSVKNTFGKLATRYDPSPDGARQLVGDPDFKRMFPQAELIDHPTDPKIRFFPDDEPVDVLIASGEGGWGWQPEGGGGGAAGAGGGFGIGTTDIDALAESDILKKIQEALAAMGKGEQPMLDEAIGQEFSMKARG